MHAVPTVAKAFAGHTALDPVHVSAVSHVASAAARHVKLDALNVHCDGFPLGPCSQHCVLMLMSRSEDVRGERKGRIIVRTEIIEYVRSATSDEIPTHSLLTTSSEEDDEWRET